MFAQENEAVPVDKLSLAKSVGQSGDVYIEPLESTLLKQEVRHQVSSAVATLTQLFASHLSKLTLELKKLKESVRSHQASAIPSAGAPVADEESSSESGSEETSSSDGEEAV